MSTRVSTKESSDDEVLVVRLTLGLLSTGALALARAARARRSDVRRVRRALACSSHEVRFVRELLRRHTNLWVFRTSQHESAGDFLVVDVSEPRISERRVVVMELKRGEPVRLVSATMHQVRKARAAVRAAACSSRALCAEATYEVFVGDPERFLTDGSWSLGRGRSTLVRETNGFRLH